MAKQYVWQLMIAAMVFCGQQLCAGESRTWTNDKGRSIKGELVTQDDTYAKIKSDKSGKIYNVKINNLSGADQAYLAGLTVPDSTSAAADDSSDDGSDAAGLAKVLALGIGGIIGIIFAVIIVGVLIQSLFLHMATRLLSFHGSFLMAIGGTILVFIMQCLGQAVSFFVISSDAAISALAGLAISALFGGFGVKLAYNEPLGKCVLAYIISLVLYVICIILLVVLALVTLGGALALA